MDKSATARISPTGAWDQSRHAGFGIHINPHSGHQFRPAHTPLWTDRCIMLTDGSLTLVCVYAPNARAARTAFYEHLALDRLTTEVLVAGDFNAVTTPLIDRRVSGRPLEEATECPAMEDWLAGFKLADAGAHWSEAVETAHDARKYARRFHTYYAGTSSSRLDRIYVTPGLVPWVARLATTPPHNTSDHLEVVRHLRAPAAAAPAPKPIPSYSVRADQRDEFRANLWPRVEPVLQRFHRRTTCDLRWDDCVQQLQRAIQQTNTELAERDSKRRKAARRRHAMQLKKMTQVEDYDMRSLPTSRKRAAVPRASTARR